ncbi:MAG TPA: SRPBCC family protein [Flavobacterium sp.]|jgi:hypothetical protein
MKILKIIGLGLLTIVVIILIVAAFSPKEYTVTRDIVINRPQPEVFSFIKIQKNQEQYSKWVMTDPNMKKSFTNNDGTVGFIYAWDSSNDQVGQGEQEITAMSDKSITCEIRFIRPWEGKATTVMTTEMVSPVQTKVAWSFQSETPFPMNAMMLFMDMDEMLGGDMAISLQNLKQILEE